MKAVTEPISFLMITFLGIIFSLLGIALLLGVLKAAPNQVAFASVQRLASAIQEACITGNDVEIEFSMQQGKSMPTSFLGVPLRAFPATRIREIGDPDFVLYYEMFPPGEGIAWEIYHDFPPRAVVVLPDGYEGKSAKDLENFIGGTKEKIRQKLTDVEDVQVVVANIKITPDIDVTTGEKVEEKKIKGFFGFGEWVPSQGNEVFRFSNYMNLERMDKTFVKYMACGDNALCLKTNEGVYAFSLEECKGIDYIQFYSPRKADTQSQVRASQVRARDGDLNIASPCEAKLRIFRSDCKGSPEGMGIAGRTFHTCDSAIEYPIFAYDPDNDRLKNISSHRSCLDPLGGDKRDEIKNELPCIRVEYKEKEGGHCYTYNMESIGIKIDEPFLVNPVKDSTDHIYYKEKDSDIFLFKRNPKPYNAFINYLTNFFEMVRLYPDDEWWWP